MNDVLFPNDLNPNISSFSKYTFASLSYFCYSSLIHHCTWAFKLNASINSSYYITVESPTTFVFFKRKVRIRWKYYILITFNCMTIMNKSQAFFMDAVKFLE